jgi:hypothetical protein
VLGIDPLPGETEAGADAGRRGDAAEARDAHDSGPTFCEKQSPTPSLCADFDETDWEKGWDNDGRRLCPGTAGGGTIQPSTKHYVSAPRSFYAYTPDVVMAGGSSSALLVKVLPLEPSVALELELFVDELDIPTGDGATTFALLNYGDTVGFVALILDSSGMELGVLYPQGDHGVAVSILPTVPTGQWIHVELLVQNAPSDGGPDGWVSVDTGGGGTATAVLPATFQVPTGNPIYPALEIGSTAQGPIGAVGLYIDNVVLNLYAADGGPPDAGSGSASDAGP